MLDRVRFEAALRVVQSCGVLPYAPRAIALHLFDSLLSTNQTAWELIAQTPSQLLVAIATQQQAGRGQRGHQWRSEAGGLYLSVGLMPHLPACNAAQLTLCTAWGIATALQTVPGVLSGVAEQIPVQIKWLNDLILQGRKLGGILTETRIQQEHVTQAVVGVGVNWANPVPPGGINLETYLQNQQTPLIESLEMLAAMVLHGLLYGYQQWQRHGIEPILPQYLELLAHPNRPIEIDGRTGSITGITCDGALQVQLQPRSTDTMPYGIKATAPEEILLKPGTISLGYDMTEFA